MRREYRVSWDIDIDADSPQDAAAQAEAYMGTHGARVYEVAPWPTLEERAAKGLGPAPIPDHVASVTVDLDFTKGGG